MFVRARTHARVHMCLCVCVCVCIYSVCERKGGERRGELKERLGGKGEERERERESSLFST